MNKPRMMMMMMKVGKTVPPCLHPTVLNLLFNAHLLFMFLCGPSMNIEHLNNTEFSFYNGEPKVICSLQAFCI